ncbi:unnamed protein product, partial [Rotaria sp. Silwood1]
MQNNKWESQNVTVNSSFSDYTLAFHFVAPGDNRTDDPIMNKTIYFALDNIELYDYNCSYMRDQLLTSTPSTATDIPEVTDAQEEKGIFL